MSFIDALGEQYGLSPAVLAGLANISGQDMPPPDASWTGNAPAPAGPPPPPPPVDPGIAHSPPPAPANPMTMGPPMAPIDPQQGAELAQGFSNRANPKVDRGVPMLSQDAMVSAPAQVIPGHMQLSSQETSREGGMPDALAEQYANYRIGAEDKRTAADLATARNNSIMGRAMEETRANIVSDELMQAHRARQMQNEMERQEYVRRNAEQVQQAAADASRKVDPEDLWKGNTFGRALAAIAVGLGQFGATLTHTENGAMHIIDGAIRDNIDAQKSNIANAQNRMVQLRNEKMDRIHDLDDDTDRHAAMTLMYIDQTKQMAIDWAKKTGLDLSSPQFLKLQADLDDRRANVIKDVATNANGKITEKQTQKWQAAQTLGGPAPAHREGNLVTTADGTTYKFDSDKSAEEGRAKLQAFGDVQLLTNKILQIRKETMKLDPVIDRQKYESNKLILQTLDDQLAVADSKANGQGTVTEADTKRRKEVGLDPTAGLGTFKGIGHLLGTGYEAANAAYENSIKTNSERQDAYIQAASPELYQRYYARDAHGNLVPSGSYTGQDAQPQQALAPRGSTSLDGKSRVNVAGPTGRELTPLAPVSSGTVSTSTSAGTKHHGKRK